MSGTLQSVHSKRGILRSRSSVWSEFQSPTLIQPSTGTAWPEADCRRPAHGGEGMQPTYTISLRARRAETDFCISGLEQAPEPDCHQHPLLAVVKSFPD